MTITAPAGQLHVRQFQVRALDQDQDTGDRTVTGIAVPFNTEVRVSDWLGDYYEQVAPGACQVRDGEPKLFWNHGEIIGRVTDHSDTDDGWQITAQISDTTAGRDAYALLRDGAVDRFSIGFVPIEHTTREDDDGVEHITRTRIEVREVSLVPFPAYQDAAVTAVRTAATNTKEPTMQPATAADVDALREGLDVLTRKVETLPDTLTPTTPAPIARSFGEFVRKIAAGDETAIRAYEGAVSGDGVLHDAWVGDLVEILHRRQVVADTFQRGTLPAKGMSVEYALIEDDTTQVGVQEDEGDELAFGKVSVTTETAPVLTLGGWSSLSRQAIERTDNVSVLDTTFRAMAEKYARAVELQARSAFESAVAAAGSITGDLTTQDGVVAALLELAEYYDDLGLSFDGLFVARDVFQALYAVPAEDRVLQVSGAPTDKVGTITVNTLEGNLSGIQVRVLPGAEAGLVAAYDATAIRTLESAGAPVRLQDDNVINLTRDFSVYGYVSAFTQRPAGIVTVGDGTEGDGTEG